MIKQIHGSINHTGSEKLYDLGEIYCAPEGREYVYGKYEHSASVTCQRGDFVSPFSSSDDFGDMNVFTADYSDGVLADLGYVAVAMGSHGTTTSYGWFQKTGTVTARQGTTEAIEDGDPLRLKGDKQPTKFEQTGVTSGETLPVQSYLAFGVACEDFNTSTDSLKKTIRLKGW